MKQLFSNHTGSRMNACLITFALTSALACTGSAQAQTLTYLGQQIVPTGLVYAGTTVGGLSGLDRKANGNYVAISDDRSGLNPARFYELGLDLNQFVRSATPGFAGVGFLSVTTLLKPDGTPFAGNTVDPEALRIHPGSGNFLWANEGQRGGAGVPALQNPTVREMTPGGIYTRDFAVPTRYHPVGTGAADPGIRNNLAFESLAVSTDGQTLYAATENALVQDGPATALGVASPSRIVSFNLATGAAGAEYVYRVEPVALPASPPGGFMTNGLVELLAFGDRQFIAIERSFSAGAATPGAGPFGPTGNTIRLYRVDARGATDVSGVDSLVGAIYTPVAKTLLLNLSDLKNDDGSSLALDNIEGISWGPMVDGKQTLILVSDNNFGAAQFTQFVALQLATPIPEPATLSMLLGGLAVLLGRRAKVSATRSRCT